MKPKATDVDLIPKLYSIAVITPKIKKSRRIIYNIEKTPLQRISALEFLCLFKNKYTVFVVDSGFKCHCACVVVAFEA